MRYFVEGAHRETGEPFRGVIDAADEQAAREIANSQGVLVSHITPHTQAVEAQQTDRSEGGMGPVPSRAVTPLVQLDRKTQHTLIVTVAFGIVLGHILTALLVMFLLCAGVGSAVGVGK